jgi:hypothetical protein
MRRADGCGESEAREGAPGRRYDLATLRPNQMRRADDGPRSRRRSGSTRADPMHPHSVHTPAKFVDEIDTSPSTFVDKAVVPWLGRP